MTQNETLIRRWPLKLPSVAVIKPSNESKAKEMLANLERRLDKSALQAAVLGGELVERDLGYFCLCVIRLFNQVIFVFMLLGYLIRLFLSCY